MNEFRVLLLAELKRVRISCRKCGSATFEMATDLLAETEEEQAARDVGELKCPQCGASLASAHLVALGRAFKALAQDKAIEVAFALPAVEKNET